MAGRKKTEEVTLRGRPVWVDEKTGESFSEVSITLPYGDGWVVMPTVGADGSRYSEDAISDYIKESGPVDWLTGEKLPVFEDMETADKYARWRSDSMFDEEALKKGFIVEEPTVEDTEEDGFSSAVKNLGRTLQSTPALVGRNLGLSTYPTKDNKDGFAEGGEVRSMKEQMSLFEYGGLADDGMDREPVTGNEIPPGSMASEVRDDIPAQLSEGEYVVPADVVRYFGVRFFEDLRNQAKSGMMEMEADGRIGGEPVTEEGTPVEAEEELSPEELAMLQEVLGQAQATGMAEGGDVSQPTFNPANYQLGYSGAGQQTPQAQTTSPSSGYENKWYINAAGERRVVMFMNGQPLAPIPEGFVEDTAENRQALAQKPEEDVVVETAGMSSDAGNEDLGATTEASGEGVGAGSIQGALQGAQMGSAFGPIGAIAGAVIGAMTSEQQTAADPEAQAQTSATTGGSSEDTNVSAMDVAMDAAGLKGSTPAPTPTSQEQEVSGTPSVSSTGEAPSSEGTGGQAGDAEGADVGGFDPGLFAKGGLATKKTTRRKPSAIKKRTTRKGLGGKK